MLKPAINPTRDRPMAHKSISRGQDSRKLSNKLRSQRIGIAGWAGILGVRCVGVSLHDTSLQTCLGGSPIPINPPNLRAVEGTQAQTPSPHRTLPYKKRLCTPCLLTTSNTARVPAWDKETNPNKTPVPYPPPPLPLSSAPLPIPHHRRSAYFFLSP